MDVQALLKFAPFLTLLGRPISEVPPSAVEAIASTFAAGDPGKQELALTLIKGMQSAHPEQLVSTLIANPAFRGVLKDLATDLSDKPRAFYSRCPACGLAFETHLIPQE
jgi:hypothetical protein